MEGIRGGSGRIFCYDDSWCGCGALRIYPVLFGGLPVRIMTSHLVEVLDADKTYPYLRWQYENFAVNGHLKQL